MLKTNGASKGLLSHAGDITHNEAGKPLFRGYHISVSHTKGYAALILSKNQEVAVDIEYFSDRVERIASKFLRKDEKAEDLDAKLVHWCAKETVFKLFSEEKLMFEDMRVKPFDTMADWSCDVRESQERKDGACRFRVNHGICIDLCCVVIFCPSSWHSVCWLEHRIGKS